MKKFILGLLSLSLILGLTACGSGSSNSASDSGTGGSDFKSVTSDTSSSSGDPADSVAVVYFSATGNTRQVAQKLADSLNAELFDIQPEEPYTQEDLDYSNDNCRANQEMNDDSARPAIQQTLNSLSGYDTIYLGYPIWWGTAPRIINTFLESYDLTGKTLYLFCTSGSSGIEQSLSDLHTLYPDLNIADGQRFSSDASDEEMESWLANNR